MTSPNWDDSGSKWNRAAYATLGSPMRAIVTLLLIGVLTTGAGWAFGWFTADTRGAIDARETILADGDFRIQAYQQFFDLCAGIEAQEGRADLFAADEDNPLASTNLQAVLAVRIGLVTEYNSLAARSWTEGQFRDEDLPYNIRIGWLPGEEGTTCEEN